MSSGDGEYWTGVASMCLWLTKRTPSRADRKDGESMSRRMVRRLFGPNRWWACIAIAALPPTLGCAKLEKNYCDGHDVDETWCDQDEFRICRWDGDTNYVETVEHCMPGGCYKNVATGSIHCIVPKHTCPVGATGYQCLGDRRIDCATDGLAWDEGDCTWSAGPDAPSLHCVPNLGGEALPCGYTTEQCTTPDEIRCMGNGTVICRDSVWQAYVPSASAGQAVCDASKIRYTTCESGNVTGEFTWCEGDQVLRCDECVGYSDAQTKGETLCVAFTKLAQCEPGACISHDNNGFPSTIAGCKEPASECSSAGQIVCRGDRPGYCVTKGIVALARPCSEIWAVTNACELDARYGNAECN
jgi:hypothetical protein